MPRLRLGVALLVPPPAAGEVDVLRRACGDEPLDRIAPHCTLVPPVNVREDRLDEAVALLRRVAAATSPITVTLGPPETFLPATPVLYLSVSSGAESVCELRDRVFAEPLARRLTWPFHPHVTLRDGGEPPRLSAAVEALAGYRVEVTFAGAHLLQERRDDSGRRVWRPLADAAFARPAVVGRGGLELELSVSEQLDPEAAVFSRREQPAPAGPSDAGRGARGLAMTARRDGRVVGTAVGWTGGVGAFLGELVVAAASRGEGIGSQLVAAFLSEAAARGCSVCRVQSTAGAGEEFWHRLGWIEEGRFDRYSEEGEVVQLRRDL